MTRKLLGLCVVMMLMTLTAWAFWYDFGTETSQSVVARPELRTLTNYPAPYNTAFLLATPDNDTNENGVHWGYKSRNHESQTDQPFNINGSLLAIDNTGSGSPSPNKVYLSTSTWLPQYKCQVSGDSRWHPFFPLIRVMTPTSTTITYFDVSSCSVSNTFTLPSSPAFSMTPSTGFTGEGTVISPDLTADNVYMAIADTARKLVRVVKLDRLNPVYGTPVNVSDCGIPNDSCIIAHVDITDSARHVVVRYSGFDIPRIYQVNSDLSMTQMDYDAGGLSPNACTNSQDLPGNNDIPSHKGYIWPVAHEDNTINTFDNYYPHHDIVVGKNKCGTPAKGDTLSSSVLDPTGLAIASQVMQIDIDTGKIAPLTYYACTGSAQSTCPGATTGTVEYDLNHVSLRGARGWAYPGMVVLTYGQTDQWGGQGKRGKSEIVLAEIRGTNHNSISYVRLLKAHSQPVTGDDASQPKAVASPGGTLLTFGSNWCLDTGQQGSCQNDTQINAYIVPLTTEQPPVSGGDSGGDCGCSRGICCK